MEALKLHLFQQQVLTQCKFALHAAEMIPHCLQLPPERDPTGCVFCNIQNLLAASANISKLLWGQRNTSPARAERQPLRASLGVEHESSLFHPLNARKMRDNYDHFDERLDKWWKEHGAAGFVDMNVASARNLNAISANKQQVLRHYDPAAKCISFGGDELNLEALMREVADLHGRAAEAASDHLRAWERN